MGDILIRDFAPEFQHAAADLINTGLGNRFGRRDDSMNPDLTDIAAAYANDCFILAMIGSNLVGTGALIYESSLVVRIARMHTADPFRRHGVGSALLLELERRAIVYGAREIILDTNVDWYDAHAFYASAGYRELRRNADDIRFHKLLPAATLPRDRIWPHGS